MIAQIHDVKALGKVSPAALAAHARHSGWTKIEPYGDHADVYAGPELPEIILPRHQRLGDYTSVVSKLIEVFARATDTSEPSLYRDLVTADRDLIRLRTEESEDGSIAAEDGLNLLGGAYKMLQAAACSVDNPQPSYRAGAHRAASDYLRRVRLGQTEHGSFVITLLTPEIPPPMQPPINASLGPDEDPHERKVTRRLASALATLRRATEATNAGDEDAFRAAVKQGVSANLCEAVGDAMGPFPTLDVTITWARTRPVSRARDTVRFAAADRPILREAARLFREHEPELDVKIPAHVRRLQRHEDDEDGTVTLLAWIHNRTLSVKAVLRQVDYERAVAAHKEKAMVIADGDLERVGQRWHLRDARIVDVIREIDAPTEDG